LDLEALGVQKLKSAVQEFNRLSNGPLKTKKIGLLHGRMKRDDKERVMIDFKQGRYDVLVATTVIEVGIDIPNATVMMILNSERFGLSTLHQLRGRVGRGQHMSCCLVLTQAKTEAVQKRLGIFLRCDNGFDIAEEDLKLRGPGEIFGTTQHGLPPFKIADFNKDLKLLKMAKETAQKIILQDPELGSPKHGAIRSHIRVHFFKSWFMANIA